MHVLARSFIWFYGFGQRGNDPMYSSQEGDEMSGIRWLVSLFCSGRSTGHRWELGVGANLLDQHDPAAFGNYNAVATTDLATTGTVHYWCSGNVVTRTVYLSKG
jgi:hypothetical protein